MRPGSRLLAGFALLIVVHPAGAQDNANLPRRGWVTVGVGAGLGPSRGLALATGGSYSVGPAVATARFDATGPWFGEQVRGKALLIGVRSGSPAWFALAAAGVARTHAFLTCECGGEDYGRATLLALEAKVFHAFEYAASSLSVYGTVGPRRHRYVAVTLSRDFGWFGATESTK